MLCQCYLESPVGNILIVADDNALHQISFVNVIPDGFDHNISNALIKAAKEQLSLYFSGRLTQFDLPLKLGLTEFQNLVLEEVKKIPYGQTVTYSQLAKRMGSLKLTRAVAAANASNQILIAIPCHRVIGKNNDLTGYAGELWRKEWLLRHENAIIPLLF
jgi:methylated-DNA-[protein]-cysteine S-methyltransferase